jgi:hypothetical protein
MVIAFGQKIGRAKEIGDHDRRASGILRSVHGVFYWMWIE